MVFIYVANYLIKSNDKAYFYIKFFTMEALRLSPIVCCREHAGGAAAVGGLTSQPGCPVALLKHGKIVACKLCG
jgi:hypothetical protein